LKDKQLELYQIIDNVKIFYHLHLFESMKQLHSIFNLKLLHSCHQDLLSEQHLKSFKSLTIENVDY